MHAAERVREAGYRWFDCHTPFPVHGLDKAMGVKPTILPILVFFGGLTGADHRLPAAVVHQRDELRLLAAGARARLRLPHQRQAAPRACRWMPDHVRADRFCSRPWARGPGCCCSTACRDCYHPTLKSERFARVTDDRFFVVIEAKDPAVQPAAPDGGVPAARCDPLSIEVLED
jgi:hypothetical protein